MVVDGSSFLLAFSLRLRVFDYPGVSLYSGSIIGAHLCYVDHLCIMSISHRHTTPAASENVHNYSATDSIDSTVQSAHVSQKEPHI